MSGRAAEVAARCGVAATAVEWVDVETVRAALAGTIEPVVLEVATQEPARYWRVGGRYFLDDPLFGEVADFGDLVYDADLGLRDRTWS